VKNSVTIGTWELINNTGFKVVEFDHFKMQAGFPCQGIKIHRKMMQSDISPSGDK